MMKRILGISAVACLLAFQTPVFAQQSSVGTPPVASQQDYSEMELLKFAVAMDAMREIGAKYEKSFQDADTPEQAQQIQQKAQNEMVQAVEAAGLTTEQYSTIAQQAQQDEALRDRILNMSRAQAE